MYATIVGATRCEKEGHLLVSEIDGLVLLALVMLANMVTLSLVDDSQHTSDGLADNLASYDENKNNTRPITS